MEDIEQELNGVRMRLLLVVLAAGLLLFSGCRSTASVYERDDLITIAHNKGSDYTLLVYQSATGRIRKVLRRNGVCELLLFEADDGDFYLKERGNEAKKLTAITMESVQAHLDKLIYGATVPSVESRPMESL